MTPEENERMNKLQSNVKTYHSRLINGNELWQKMIGEFGNGEKTSFTKDEVMGLLTKLNNEYGR